MGKAEAVYLFPIKPSVFSEIQKITGRSYQTIRKYIPESKNG